MLQSAQPESSPQSEPRVILHGQRGRKVRLHPLHWSGGQEDAEPRAPGGQSWMHPGGSAGSAPDA